MENSRTSVLLISVDALKPEFVFEQERLSVRLPNLKQYFVEGGTFAGEGVESVFPTVTYPCHQSMITGVRPIVHGIYSNSLFDPMLEHLGAYRWFASRKAENLWEAAKKKGYLSASVAFPTSLGVRGDFIIPEFWWDGSEMDSQFLDVMATPQGMVAEMEAEIGHYPGGLDLTEADDRQRFRAAMWILEKKIAPCLKKKPFFMTLYFASFDEMAHEYGVYSTEAAHALEGIDEMIGALTRRVHELTQDQVAVCVVSDHGMLDNRFNIRPNVKLKAAGLIRTDKNGEMLSCRAWCHRSGGTAEIRLADRKDEESRRKVRRVLTELLSKPNSGIAEVLTHDEAVKRGGFGDADYVLVAQKGYEFRDGIQNDYCTEHLHQKAQHGYSEKYEEMRAVFLLEGKGVERGRNIGGMKLIDVAPTLASLMDVKLAMAEGANRLR